MDRHEKAMKILHEGTVIPATPLALDENRHLDEDTQRLLMRYYLSCGVGGIATAVHTTQFEIRKPARRLSRSAAFAARRSRRSPRLSSRKNTATMRCF